MEDLMSFLQQWRFC